MYSIQKKEEKEQEERGIWLLLVIIFLNLPTNFLIDYYNEKHRW